MWDGSEMTKAVKVRKMTSIPNLGCAGAAIAIVALSTQAFGQGGSPPTETTDSVGNVLTVQGDVRCKQLAIEAEVRELVWGGEREPDFVLKDDDDQRIEGAVSDGTTLKWQATVPVDFVIVRGTTDGDDDDDDSDFGRASHVYVFGNDPANFDSDETAPNMSTIEQIRFCYGLPQEPETLPRCADIDDGPQCPVDDEGVERNALLATFLFDERDFGGVPQCTCGELVLRDCNENAPSDEPDSCAGGELLELPVQIEAIKNVTDTASTTCKVRGGKRRCRTTED
jgi:hypothetical protein